MIYNKKYVFGLGPGTELLKPLEFPKWEEPKNVFCNASEVTLGPPTKDRSLLPCENQPCD